MVAQENVNNVLNKLISLISEEYKISAVYLFGSYARKSEHKYSDIDVAIISDSFEGSRFNDRRKLNKFILKTSVDIEIHPFRTRDFNSTNPLVAEILKTGIKIV